MSIELINNDCIEELKKIKNESIDLVVLDPPYKIISGGSSIKKRPDDVGGIFNKMHNVNSQTKNAARTGKLFKHNDIKFKNWLPDVFRVLKDGTHCYIMVNDRNMQEMLNEAEKVGFKIQNILVWSKGTHTPNKYYLKNNEFIIMFRKGKAKNINNMGTKTIIEIPNIKRGEKLHPTEKPVELLELLISNSSNENELVLDCFMGAGSAAVACKNLNRRFVGMELDEEYFKIAKERIK